MLVVLVLVIRMLFVLVLVLENSNVLVTLVIKDLENLVKKLMVV
jgi:hypothetical protein